MKWNIVVVLLFSLIMIQAADAQKSAKRIKITGVVVDANNNPVEGVVIFVDDVKTDEVTNSKGEYSIKVSPDAKKLTVLTSYNDIKEIEINGNRVINFKLDKVIPGSVEQKEKESESVDIGYGTVKKEQSAGGSKKINVNKTRTRTYSNIYEMIKSEVPGVQVVGTSVRLLQGSGSFTSSEEPLFVVDGTIVNQIGNIDPSQVRSISLLKGADASIYGSRGANGVIVIITIK